MKRLFLPLGGFLALVLLAGAQLQISDSQPRYEIDQLPRAGTISGTTPVVVQYGTGLNSAAWATAQEIANLYVVSPIKSLLSLGEQHIAVGAVPPVLTSCGGGTPAVTGSNTAGIVTMGTSATGCIITFATTGGASAFTGTPYCVVSWIATPLASQSYVTSNTAITLTQTSASSNVVQYICLAPSGG